MSFNAPFPDTSLLQTSSSTNSNIMSATEEQQKAEKEKSVPKDAQVMISILKDMGINEFEPRVVNQMLEFSYRYALFERS